MDQLQAEAQLTGLETDARLDEPMALAARRDALRFLDLIDELVRLRGRWEDWAATKQRAHTLRRRLEKLNAELGQRFRARLMTGDWTPTTLREELNRYTAYTPRGGRPRHMGYDGLDDLLRVILHTGPPPPPMLSREPEMIHLESTPARVILDLIDHVPLTPRDVFYDIGSGLGEVVMLFHLLTGLPARGLEYEPAYCRRARRTARELGLTGVKFLNVDAREADYSAATILFMFTPFRGSLLRAVLDRLCGEAERRSIILCCYGPCSPVVAREPWLRADDPSTIDEFHLVVLHSAQ